MQNGVGLSFGCIEGAVLGSSGEGLPWKDDALVSIYLLNCFGDNEQPSSSHEWSNLLSFRPSSSPKSSAFPVAVETFLSSSVPWRALSPCTKST